MKYSNELSKSMKFLSKNKNVIFLGQSVNFSGNAIYNTLKSISPQKKIEMPVFEDVQMGMTLGLAMNGFIPVSCFPRFDFLILAMNQRVNHIDKFKIMTEDQFKPRIIIRTSIGPKKPLDGGPQHTNDYTKEFRGMLTDVEVIYLNKSSTIFQKYKNALTSKSKRIFLFVEDGKYYNS